MSPTLHFSFGVSQHNASVCTDPWSSGNVGRKWLDRHQGNQRGVEIEFSLSVQELRPASRDIDGDVGWEVTMAKVKTTCRLCLVRCGMVVETDKAGTVKRITGDREPSTVQGLSVREGKFIAGFHPFAQAHHPSDEAARRTRLGPLAKGELGRRARRHRSTPQRNHRHSWRSRSGGAGTCRRRNISPTTCSATSSAARLSSSTIRINALRRN